MEKMVKTSIIETNTILYYDVTQEDINDFNEAILNKRTPNEYILETKDGIFKINKEKKLLIVLDRNYKTLVKENGSLIVYNPPVDFEVMRLCKVAKKLGFEYLLEKKQMN